MNQKSPIQNQNEILDKTKNWILKSVIGLNLCPFAKLPFQSNRIRYVICDSPTKKELLLHLRSELKFLSEVDPLLTETTLIIHPNVLADFLDQNDFLDEADLLLNQLDLDGVIQIANFHPQFQFADKTVNDITNYVGRSPYPTLHLLREENISQIVDSHPNIESIYKNNRTTFTKLGHDGWIKLWL
ncbi:DUF1415 domain-containing protein [Leptospira sp. 2 VSF19]|uniref:DUF1415 domain-containing protein n=1 Tax=Leptospira soteropolitanensis TaxID=2950025 RepID=A0AAW5VMJ1_9LEPT|nr:DUF1415 domain-containing protein [Leptospira soteropolitanensis]MCW7493603.1 DUF1415 domain-containing protein [Leptospira soteropolitanensis]MCW7501202.1 DUF1415 domain-containing protein [Leptospira soteropolitanensis]MCW7523612.1 DUF1415 domain-containing protein [Leptospira soteropolitanensis]MCW7527315.1 DUF1415 domain-containing protein [Leptospira soteropolitanensis]MCW7531172.1 DUF1415 domain-containing protein [Leptospira soteropolitanensis]